MCIRKCVCTLYGYSVKSDLNLLLGFRLNLPWCFFWFWKSWPAWRNCNTDQWSSYMSYILEPHGAANKAYLGLKLDPHICRKPSIHRYSNLGMNLSAFLSNVSLCRRRLYKIRAIKKFIILRITLRILGTIFMIMMMFKMDRKQGKHGSCWIASFLGVEFWLCLNVCCPGKTMMFRKRQDMGRS